MAHTLTRCDVAGVRTKDIVAGVQRRKRCENVEFGRIMQSLRRLQDDGMVMEVATGIYQCFDATSGGST